MKKFQIKKQNASIELVLILPVFRIPTIPYLEFKKDEHILHHKINFYI